MSEAKNRDYAASSWSLGVLSYSEAFEATVAFAPCTWEG